MSNATGLVGGWVPYSGLEAVILAVVLLIIGLVFAYAGFRLKSPLGVKRPGRGVAVFMVIIWVLSIPTFYAAYVAYIVQLVNQYHAGAISQQIAQTAPSNPVTPVTILSAVATFIIIALISRRSGLKVTLGSAFVGAAAAPMIFELPFDLIVINRTVAIPPSPILYRLLFFLPLIIIEISTMSLLTLSPLTRVSKYTLWSLAGVFFVFAIWGALGFTYPINPLYTLLNDVSKILCFVTSITLFLKPKTVPATPKSGFTSDNPLIPEEPAVRTQVMCV
jgi:hypothetical protein